MLIRPAKNKRVFFGASSLPCRNQGVSTRADQTRKTKCVLSGALSVFTNENIAFQHVLIRPAKNERVHLFAFLAFTTETKVLQHVMIDPLKAFQHVLIRPAKNERVHVLALPVFSSEIKVFQPVLIRPAKKERVRFLALSTFNENRAFRQF